MAKVSDTYPDTAAFMKADDLKGTPPLPVKVSTAALDTLDGEVAIVLTFEGVTKKLRLNKTNARSLAERFGDDSDGWIGKDFLLAAVPVTYEGKNVLGIRVI